MGNLALLEDACEKLPHTTRAMFGGHGLFAPNGGMFAGIVTDDEIILKLADDAARSEFVALGGHPWVYNGKMTMKDWIVIPDAFYDDPRALAQWAARAHRLAPGKAVAKGAKRAKGAKTVTTPPPTAKRAAPTPAKRAREAISKKPSAKQAAPKAPASTKRAGKAKRRS